MLVTGEPGYESPIGGSKIELRGFEIGELGAEEGAKSDGCSDGTDQQLERSESLFTRPTCDGRHCGGGVDEREGSAGAAKTPGVSPCRFFFGFFSCLTAVTW